MRHLFNNSFRPVATSGSTRAAPTQPHRCKGMSRGASRRQRLANDAQRYRQKEGHDVAAFFDAASRARESNQRRDDLSQTVENGSESFTRGRTCQPLNRNAVCPPPIQSRAQTGTDQTEACRSAPSSSARGDRPISGEPLREKGNHIALARESASRKCGAGNDPEKPRSAGRSGKAGAISKANSSQFTYIRALRRR